MSIPEMASKIRFIPEFSASSQLCRASHARCPGVLLGIINLDMCSIPDRLSLCF